MQIEDIISVIEKTAPLSGQADWDKSGVQVTREGNAVTAIAVFLDPLPSVIEVASRKAEFLLSHHPLTLEPSLPKLHDNWYYSLRHLFNTNALLYAAHTSLDVNLAGPAGWLGRMLGLENTRPLEPDRKNPATGFGGIGELPVPRDFEDVIQEVLTLAKCGEATLCGKEPGRKITRIAWCGGSGSSLIPLAKAAGADLFITGDVKHHSAVDALLPVLDVGHHSLEEEMMRRFANLLREQIPSMTIDFIPTKPPFKRIRQGV